MADLGKEATENMFKKIKNHFYALGYVSDDALDTVRAKMKDSNLSEDMRDFLKEMEKSLVCIQKHVTAGGEDIWSAFNE